MLINLEEARTFIPKYNDLKKLYNKTEKEDLARYLIDGAEIQRDNPINYYTLIELEKHIPTEDCGDTVYNLEERYEIARYMAIGAKIQREREKIIYTNLNRIAKVIPV